MNWSINDAKDLYSIKQWGLDYFDINDAGEVIVNLQEKSGNIIPVPLSKIVNDQDERGRPVPLLIRFRDLLDRRIEALKN